MYKVKMLPHAKEDIKQASIWYKNKQLGLEKRFLEKLKEKVLFIEQNPLACNIRYKNTRTALVNTFPFMIHYIIEDKTIIILAILHTSRNPDLWENR